jgi:hypothetical protein
MKQTADIIVQSSIKVIKYILYVIKMKLGCRKNQLEEGNIAKVLELTPRTSNTKEKVYLSASPAVNISES